MNKNRYRIIFNQARGLLMVVSELTKSNCSSGNSPVSSNKLIRGSLLAKLTPVTALLYCCLGWVTLANAEVVADRNASQNLQPQVSHTANGITEVNIQTPSAGGVSRNQYSQFDVDNRGVILNNSRQHVKTELGGYVEGNPFLIGGEAKVILNEVNSANPSQLNGFVEVAGKKAQVIIANPSGITCNGCGFINSDRATLTTGQVLMDAGQISGYQVNGGTISIQGKGLDSSRQNYTELLARSVEVNAKVWALNLDVVSGSNKISADLSSIEATAASNNNKPKVAIDVAALGGMYANRIHLIGTEAGVGVYNAGEIGSAAGAVVINANGVIENSGTMMTGTQLSLSAQQDIINSGEMNAKQQLALNAAGNIVNQNILESKDRIDLNAGQNVTNQVLFAEKALTITAKGHVNNLDTIKSDTTLSIKAGGNVDNAKVVVAKNITIDSQGSITNQQVVKAKNDLHLKAAKDIHLNVAAAGQLVDIKADGAIRSNGLITSQQGDLGLKATKEIVTHELYARDSLTATSGTDFINRSIVKSDGQLMINAGENLSTEKVTAKGRIELIAQKDVINHGIIASKDSVELKVGNNLTTVLVDAANQLTINADQNVINSQLMQAGQNLSLHAGNGVVAEKIIGLVDVRLDANGSISTQKVTAGKDLTITAGQDIESSTLYGKANVYLTSGGKLNNSQLIQSDNDLVIDAGDDVVTQTVLAGHDATIASQGKLENKHILAVENNLAITTDNDVISKVLYAKNDLSIGTGASVINHQKIETGGKLNVTALNDIVSQQVFAKGDTSLNARGNLQNHKALEGQGNVHLSAGGNIDSQIIYSHQDLTIESDGYLTNTTILQADNHLQVNSHSDINSQIIKGIAGVSLNADGNISYAEKIVTAQEMNIRAGKQLTGTTLFAAKSMTLNVGEHLTSHEMIQADGELNINVTGNLDSKIIKGLANANIDVDGKLTNSEILAAQQDLTIQAGGDVETAILLAKGQLDFNSQGSVNNTQSIAAGQDLNLNVVGGLHSQKIASQQNITLTTTGQINNQSIISAQNNLSIKAGGDVSSAIIFAKNDATITTEGTIRSGDTIQTGRALRIFAEKDITSQKVTGLGDVWLQANGMINNHDILAAQKNLTITTGQDITSQILFARQQMNIISAATINSAEIESGQKMSLKTGSDMLAHKIIAGNDLDLDIKGKLTNQDLISSQGHLTIRAQSDINNGSSTYAAGTTVVYAKENITLTSQGNINNSDIIHADGNLSLKAAGNIDSAKLVAMGDLTIDAEGNLENRNSITAQGNLTVKQGGSIHNHNLIYAIGDVIINTTKWLENRNIIATFGNLNVNALDITNHKSAMMAAGVDQQTRLLQSKMLSFNATGQLANYGVLDAGFTLIKSQLVKNVGNAQIYGNRIALQAGGLDNLSQDGVAAVIASRDEMDLGVAIINNRDHALIYSDGDLRIGGQLSEANRATNQGSMLNNHSATVEAGNNLWLSMHTINNINDRIETEIREISRQQIVEYQAGTTTHYRPDQVSFHHDEVLHITSPDVSARDNFNEYRFTRVIEESVITHSEPAKISAGKNLAIEAKQLINDNSHIIAGHNSSIKADSEKEIEAKGKRIISDIGSVINYYRIKEKGRDSQGEGWSAHKPAAVIEQITLRSDASVTHVDLVGLTQSDREVTLPQKPTNTERTQRDFGDKLVSIEPESSSFNRESANVGGSLTGLPGSGITKPEGESNLGHELIKEPDINIGLPTIAFPKNSLFKPNPDVNGDYLVETDPRFTNHKQWLSSGHMLDRLKRDPNNLHKRLGDGFYEQRLIREQIINKTGLRYLDGYHSDEEQFRGLMQAGIEFADQYHLTVGVALTAEQMSHLTQDLVWLVKSVVQMPDGSQQTVLVPQVYTRVRAGDLDGSGALLSGRNVNIQLNSTFDNSGKIRAAEQLTISADRINTIGGLMSAKDLSLIASSDIFQQGGHMMAGEKLSLQAGNNIDIRSMLNSNSNDQSSHTNIAQVAALTVHDGDLTLQAGKDINLSAMQLVNQSKQGTTSLSAGNDINFATLTTSKNQQVVFDSDNYTKQSNTEEVGSKLVGEGNVKINAQQDVNFKAVEISVAKQLSVEAGNDINISEGRATVDYENRTKSTGKTGGGAKISNETFTSLQRDDAINSQLTGNNIELISAKNTVIRGSQVISDNNLTINAGEKVTIEVASQDSISQQWQHEQRSGLMSGGKIGFTVGSISEKTTTDNVDNNYVAAVVGSTAGNVAITAGKDVNITASDVIAKQDLQISGQNVVISSADNVVTEQERYEREQSGFTLAIGGTVADVYEAMKAISQSRKEDNNKLAALQSIKAALSAIESIQQMEKLNDTADKNGASVSIELTYGFQKTERETNYEGHNVVGSSVAAGHDLGVTARGDEQQQGGDIHLTGSELKAGNDISLTANQDLHVTAAANTQHSDSTTTEKGGGGGISIGLGQGKQGIRGTGNANYSKERENMDGSAWTESVVDAGQVLKIQTGQDAKIIGGQLKGDSVKAEIGRDLLVQSLQDSDEFDYKKVSGSVSASGGLGGFDANLSLSKTKIESDYASVTDQAGIYAGEGGFDIRVGEHTELTGAVIASKGEPDKNRLDTGTLGFSDIENKANFSVDHISVSVGTGGIAPPVKVNKSESASSVTYSAVGQGEIVIRDKEKQQQDIGSLSRNTENANNPLGQIFDKQKELDRIAALQLIAEISQKVGNVAQNAALISAQDEAKKAGDPTKKELAEAKARLEKDMKENPGKYEGKDMDKLVYGAVIHQRTSNLMKGNGTNMGGSVSKAISSVTSIVQGIVSGNIAGGLAGGASPYIAEQIKMATTVKDHTGKPVLDAQGNPEVDMKTNLLLHGLLGAVTGQLGSGNGVAGAAGAMSGEAAAELIYQARFGSGAAVEDRIRKEDLSESQKQEIAALAGLTGALAGAISASGESQAAGEALTTAKNAVENNWASPAGAGGNLGFWFSKIPDCDEACKAEMALQQAEGNAKVLVIEAGVIGTAVGGYYLVGATPEIIAAARVAISACKGNPVYCLNQVGIHAGEIFTEGGIGAMGALVVGKSVKDVGKLESIGKDAVRKLVEISDSGKLKSASQIEKTIGKATDDFIKSESGSIPLPNRNKSTSVILKEVEIASGEKGNWNKALNKPEPNTRYKVDGDKIYETDHLGRPNNVEANLTHNTKDRNTYQQCKAGKCGNIGDEGGHLIASIFNGPGEKLNLLPMDGNLNKGAWKQMENTWAKALKEGKEVKVNIQPSYIGNSTRPENFKVSYSIDGGRPIIVDFKNAPGGK